MDRANRTSGDVKLEHIYRAAEYNLSTASTSKEAAEFDLKDGDMVPYHTRMGTHFTGRSAYHYYRAWAHEELGNWLESLQEYEQSKKECQKAIEQNRKALRLDYLKIVKQNLQKVEDKLKDRIDDIARIRPKAEKAKLTKATKSTLVGATPNLDVTSNLLKA